MRLFVVSGGLSKINSIILSANWFLRAVKGPQSRKRGGRITGKYARSVRLGVFEVIAVIAVHKPRDA